MKVIKLITNPILYSSNAYLILGTWNKISDVNTLIDTGSDGYILDHIEKINTGVGKKPVDKVILTHNHFDHTGGTRDLKQKFDAEVLSFTATPYTTRLLKPGENLLLGDCYFEVIHTPGHSSDSISLYCKSDGVLFSGDTNLRIHQPDESYSEEFIQTIERLSRLKINVIYPGHGEPLDENPERMIRQTLQNIKTNRQKKNAITE